MEPGGLGQLFRALLGLHSRPREGQEGREGMLQGRESMLQGREDYGEGRETPPEGTEADLYKVFTNPLEMNRFFEEQMDEMLRNFGQGFFGGSLRSGPMGPYGGGLQELPAPHPDLEQGDKRDFMLNDDGGASSNTESNIPRFR